MGMSRLKNPCRFSGTLAGFFIYVRIIDFIYVRIIDYIADGIQPGVELLPHWININGYPPTRADGKGIRAAV